MEEWLPQTTTFLMCSVLAPSFLAAWEDVVCTLYSWGGRRSFGFIFHINSRVGDIRLDWKFFREIKVAKMSPSQHKNKCYC